jgi:superfamily II DNA or RNA helicase
MNWRDYQTRCIGSISSGWKQFARQLIVVCTGGGKTIIFAKVAKDEVDSGGRVLVLAHTEELIDQAIDKIRRTTGIECGKEKAASEAYVTDNVVVASVQTLSRPIRLAGWLPDHFSLIIIDEAHHAIAKMYETILAHFSGARVLGVTATADRGDKKNLSAVFENVAAEFNLIDAVKQGWLVRPVVKTVPVQIDMHGVQSKQGPMGYDYDVKEVTHRLEPLIDAMCASLVQEIGARKTVVYLPSIHLAKMAAEATRQRGVKAQFVSGECTDRAEKMQKLRDGLVQVTFNAYLLVEGFDDDSIACISVWRPTKIRSLLEQCVGRGLRPLREIVAELDAAGSPEERRLTIAGSAKPDMLILDYLWLTDKLDLVRPTDLVVTNFDIAQHAKKIEQQGDLMDLAEYAARDYLKKLEETIRKNARRKARVIDPLAFAVETHDEELETYEPSSRWEMVGPSKEQCNLLAQFGINPARVTTKGFAHKLIDKLILRRRLKLASVQQMSFLDRLGVHEDLSRLSYDEAKHRIDTRLAELKARSPQAKKRPPQLEFSDLPKPAAPLKVEFVDIP